MRSNNLWQRASARWAEIGGIAPDLAPALALQQRLVGLLLDTSAGLDQPLPPALSAGSVGDKWRRGVPALRNEQVPIPDSLRAALPSFCTALAEGGAGDSALHIGDALVRGQIDAGSMLAVSLARNRKAIRTSALHLGFSPDLIWLIAELGSSPLAHHLQMLLMGQMMGSGTHEWDRGYCPVCGSWPAFIEALDHSHTLRCSYCAAAWALTSHRCIYCENAGDDFLAAAPRAGAGAGHLDLCGRCGNYTKVLNVPDATPFPLLAVEDLASMALDQGAMERQYGRPDLYDLDSIEPLKSNC